MFWKKKNGDDPNIDDEEYRIEQAYPAKICPLCSRSYSDDSVFCKYDGQRLTILNIKIPEILEPGEMKCPKCGNTVKAREDGSCPVCGEQLVDVSKLGKKKSVTLFIDHLYPITIDQFPYVFGRKDVARLLSSEYINPSHIEFNFNGSKLMVKDVKSLNGSKVNELIIGMKGKSFGEFEVKNGDTIELGLNGSNKGEIRMRVKINDT